MTTLPRFWITGQEKQFRAHIALYDSKEVSGEYTYSGTPIEGQVPEGSGESSLGYDVVFSVKCGGSGETGERCPDNKFVDINHHGCLCDDASQTCKYDSKTAPQYCVHYPITGGAHKGACLDKPRCLYEEVKGKPCYCYHINGEQDVKKRDVCEVGEKCYEDGQCDALNKEDEHKVQQESNDQTDKPQCPVNEGDGTTCSQQCNDNYQVESKEFSGCNAKCCITICRQEYIANYAKQNGHYCLPECGGKQDDSTAGCGPGLKCCET